MKVGDKIRLRACKADGEMYREWTAEVESCAPDLIVTIAPAGSPLFSKGNIHIMKYHMRSFYWRDKLYNLLEIFEPAGDLVEIYLNIASPPEITDDMIVFKDHELDVSKIPPGAARIVDEDEFLDAAEKYGYSKEFQEKMYAAAHDALTIAENWIANPAPNFEGRSE